MHSRLARDWFLVLVLVTRVGFVGSQEYEEALDGEALQQVQEAYGGP